MNKAIYAEDARKKMLSGVTSIAKAVKTTLGPSGRNVLIRNEKDRPFATKDGVTVAGHMASEDPFEMVAIESIQDIANKSDEMAGDGTTTATVIGEAILSAGLKHSSANLLEVKRGMDEMTKHLVKLLKENSVNVDENDQILKQVALISSNNDEEVAQVVFDAFKTSGNQGIVNIKESRSGITHHTSIEGMTIPMGYRSRAFINEKEAETCVLENPYVLMLGSKITDIAPQDNLDYLLTTIQDNGDSLLIVCDDIDPYILEVLSKMKITHGVKVCVCKTPGFGNDKPDSLYDLGTVLGKEPFMDDTIDFHSLEQEDILSHLPQSEEVTVGQHMTSIKGPIGLTDEEYDLVERKAKDRADALRDIIKTKHNDSYEKSKLNARISRLTEGLSYIHIGALTETELLEKQGRVQDALYAIKAASEEGVIPGGGAALYSLSLLAFDSISGNEDRLIGAQIVLDAIKEPFNQIIENVGVEIKENVLNDIRADFFAGYDARELKFCDNMIESGIMDPTKVTRVALESAVSIMGMLLTTECVIVDPNIYKPQTQAF